MDFKTLIYDICRDYVCDLDGVLGEQERAKILGWIRARDITRLASCRDHFPSALTSRELYRALLQIEAFFKKNSVFASEECDSVALKTFKRSERICRITNRRLDWYYTKRDRLDPDLSLYLSKAERRIEEVLGPIAPFIDQIPRLVRVTSGATASHARKESLPALKLTLKPAVSSSAVPLLSALYRYFGYEHMHPDFTEANRVEIVPKNYKTGRTIACEPEGNTVLQLAFDTYAKERLRRKTSVNLSSQVLNQQLACLGSVSGTYATEDLKMASDTAAINAVAWLFPHAWYEYLDSVRSKVGMIPRLKGSQNLRDGLVYAKFSSMGNGATFTVETLIFEACCYAVGSRDHVVYGDDIVVRNIYVDPLRKLLRFLGFATNKEKSFREGPFRESCGVNYFKGVDITPFYLREWDLRKTVLAHNVNGLASIATPEGELWKRLRDIVTWFRLPLVPRSEDTMTGVHVDVSTAYRLGLLKKGNRSRKRPNPWTMYYKAQTLKGERTIIDDSRGLALWFLSRNHKYCNQPVEVSKVTTSAHKYVRKWVRWTVPAVATPVHMYMWADYLTR